MTITETRTPLWAMTDEQLRFIANDDLADWDRRKTVTAILVSRVEARIGWEKAASTSEEDGA